MNTIARSFGIFGETPQLTFELVDRHRRGLLETIPWLEREILQVGDAYGFIFGNGIIYNFLHEYYATGTPSPATAAQLILRAAGSTMVRGPLVAPHLQAVPRARRRRRRSLGVRGLHHGRGGGRRADRPRLQAVLSRARRAERVRAARHPHRRASASSPSCRSIMAGKPMRRDKVIDQAAHHVGVRGGRAARVHHRRRHLRAGAGVGRVAHPSCRPEASVSEVQCGMMNPGRTADP